MDHRRFITFLVCFFSFFYIYNGFIAPKFFPRAPQVPAEVADPGDRENAAANGEIVRNEGAADGDADQPAEKAIEVDQHPARQVTLGSIDISSGYFLEVQLNSSGAAIESVILADPQFRDLVDQDKQLQVVGNNSSADRTFSSAVSVIDDQLAEFNQTLETIDWRVVESDAGHVVFEFTSPDRRLQVLKTYRLHKIDLAEANSKRELRNNAAGFTIDVGIEVRNLSSEAQEVVYELQGPVGVVLENEEHTRKFRDIKLEFVGDDEDAVTMSAKQVSRLYANSEAATPKDKRLDVRQAEAWTSPFRYGGVDVQFFAALLAPLDERTAEQQAASPWIDRSYPVLIQADPIEENHSDISFRVRSVPLALGPKGTNDSIVHEFGFFVGPKRSTLLDPAPLQAEQVLDYGSWFGFIARIMHKLLDTIHGIGLPYVLAIIGLTVLVRGCMFPLSRKQAISAARMKDLQPKINELKLKYGDEKEKFAKAQMELWRKHNINPLGGCVPVLFQLPVFIALYSCLNTAVDLRLAKFLWIDNLAAPDSLFRLPFSLPLLGADFNLLPCVTVVLFLIQQKLFMPPPADEQAEMQQKMMNFMTIFMGVMFWHVPAGLCIYFIASSLWGIAERKLLGSNTIAPTPAVVDVTGDSGSGSASTGKGPDDTAKATPKKEGFFARKFSKMMELAEEAQKQAEQNKVRQSKGKNKKKGR